MDVKDVEGSEPRNRWDRLDGESAPAFAAATEYFVMGPSRSLDRVAEVCGKNASLLARWSSRWAWVERSAAYDRHMGAVRQVAREQEAARQAKAWEERAQDTLETTWEDAVRLAERVRLMLTWPLARTVKDTYDDGRERTVIMPAKWSMRDVATFAKLSLEMKTAAINAVRQDRPVGDMSDEELEAVMSAHDRGKA